MYSLKHIKQKAEPRIVTLSHLQHNMMYLNKQRTCISFPSLKRKRSSHECHAGHMGECEGHILLTGWEFIANNSHHHGVPLLPESLFNPKCLETPHSSTSMTHGGRVSRQAIDMLIISRTVYVPWKKRSIPG